MTSGINCIYHTDREAKAKCEKCGSLICLECMEKVKVKRRGSGYASGSEGGHVSVTIDAIAEMCIPCAYDNKKRKKITDMIGLIFGTVFLVIIYFVFNSIGFLFDWPITRILLIIGIIILIIVIVVSTPFTIKKIKQINQEKQSFLSSHGHYL